MGTLSMDNCKKKKRGGAAGASNTNGAVKEGVGLGK